MREQQWVGSWVGPTHTTCLSHHLLRPACSLRCRDAMEPLVVGTNTYEAAKALWRKVSDTRDVRASGAAGARRVEAWAHAG